MGHLIALNNTYRLTTPTFITIAPNFLPNYKINYPTQLSKDISNSQTEISFFPPNAILDKRSSISLYKNLELATIPFPLTTCIQPVIKSSFKVCIFYQLLLTTTFIHFYLLVHATIPSHLSEPSLTGKNK